MHWLCVFFVFVLVIVPERAGTKQLNNAVGFKAGGLRLACHPHLCVFYTAAHDTAEPEFTGKLCVAKAWAAGTYTFSAKDGDYDLASPSRLVDASVLVASVFN
jgi:hypothetical protein